MMPEGRSGQPKGSEMDANARDGKGRFVKGHAGGPGRPPRCRGDYLDTVFTTVTPAEWAKVIRKALDQAIAGDSAARAFLASHLLPREGVKDASEDPWPRIYGAAGGQ